jgi:hypothetical protein
VLCEDDITMTEKHDTVILDVMEILIQFTVEIGDVVEEMLVRKTKERAQGQDS